MLPREIANKEERFHYWEILGLLGYGHYGHAESDMHSRIWSLCGLKLTHMSRNCILEPLPRFTEGQCEEVVLKYKLHINSQQTAVRSHNYGRCLPTAVILQRTFL